MAEIARVNKEKISQYEVEKRERLRWRRERDRGGEDRTMKTINRNDHQPKLNALLCLFIS